MEFKRVVFLVFLIIFAVIVIYNYLLLPGMMQYNISMGMGMGMHGRMYQNYNTTYLNQGFLWLIALGFLLLIIAAMVLFFQQSKQKKCPRCQLPIDSENWRICPHCGARL